VYTALLDQTASGAPSATVLQNTLGGTVVWARSSTGVYTATLSSAFDINKTWFTSPAPHGSPTAVNYRLTHTSSSVVTLTTSDSVYSVAELGGRLSVEIRVYP